MLNVNPIVLETRQSFELITQLHAFLLGMKQNVLDKQMEDSCPSFQFLGGWTDQFF